MMTYVFISLKAIQNVVTWKHFAKLFVKTNLNEFAKYVATLFFFPSSSQEERLFLWKGNQLVLMVNA